MPRTFLPAEYKGPLTEEQVRRYLILKGADPDAEKPSFKEMKLLDDLGIGRVSGMVNLFGMNPKRDPLKAIQKAEDEEFEKHAVPYKAPAVTPFDYNMMKAGNGPYQQLTASTYELQVPPGGYKAEEPRKIVSWSVDIKGNKFPIYDRPADPTPYLNQTEHPWDLEHPWEVDPEQAASVIGRQDISAPQKVLNTVYESGRRMFEPMFKGAKAIGGDSVQVPEPAPVPSTGNSLGDLGQTVAQEGMGLAGFIAGPAKLAGGPAGALTGGLNKLLEAQKFGGPLVRRLIEYGVEQGATLGVANVLSDVSNPSQYGKQFAGGFKMGTAFAAGGLINMKSSPILDQLLRQVGGRAALAVMGEYRPGSGDINSQIYSELLNSFFLRKGITLKQVLATAKQARVEHTRNKFPGEFPSDQAIQQYIESHPESAGKFAAEQGEIQKKPGTTDVMAGIKPDADAMEARLQQEYSLTGDPEIAERQAREREEVKRVYGVPGAEPSTLKPTADVSQIPAGGPMGPKVEPKPEKPGEKMFDTTPDYWESYAGLPVNADAFERVLRRRMGWRQDQMNLEKLDKVEQRKLSGEEWKAAAWEQIKKRAADGLEIGMDADEMLRLLPEMSKVGRQLAKYPKFLQPLIGLGGAIKDNADYVKTLDPNTNCPRRFQYAATVDAVEKKIGRMLSGDELLGMSEMMKARGEIAPCLYCYVESARRVYHQTVKEAITKTKVDIPTEIFESKERKDAFIEANPKLADTVKRIAGKAQAASRANLTKGYSAYTGDVFKISEKDWAEIDSRAGLRMNSNTDFQVDQTLDYMRAIADLAIIKKRAHAFTKEPAFAKIFGPSKIKVFQSLYAKAPGVEDAVEGMAWKDAIANREKYPTVGTILVAQNDAVLKWALEQPWVDMVIPYHRSGMTAEQMRRLNLTDYQSRQRERWIKPSDHTGEKAPHFEFADHHNDKATYLRLCAEAGVKPRFAEYVDDPNYMKMIVDEPRLDTPHEAVVPQFDWAEARKAIATWQKGGGYTERMRPSRGVVNAVAKAVGPKAKGTFDFIRTPEEPGPPTEVNAGLNLTGAAGKAEEKLRELAGEEIPAEGHHPAIMTKDGRILVDKGGMYPTHVGFAMAKGLKPTEVESGGWVDNGVYNASDLSDVGRWRAQGEAQARVDEKRAGNVKVYAGAPLDEAAVLAEKYLRKYVDERPIEVESDDPKGVIRMEVKQRLQAGEDPRAIVEDLRQRGIDAVGPTPQAPPAPGVPLKDRSQKIIDYGTTERAALEKEGIKYLSDVGKGQEQVDAYDKMLEQYEKDQLEHPTLEGAGYGEKLPNRPTGFAELFPESKILHTLKFLSDKIKHGLADDTMQHTLETSLRWVERVGGGKTGNIIKKVFYEPMVAGGSAVNRSIGELAKRFTRVIEGEGMTVKGNDTYEIGKLLTKRSTGGDRVLELSGVDPATVKDPTPEQQRIIDWMDQNYLQAFHEINLSRIKAGLDPINYRGDYYTFWHVADMMNSQGISLINTPAEAIEAKIKEMQEKEQNVLSERQIAMRGKSKIQKFMFEKRSGKLGAVDLDAFGVFTRYMHSAYEQMYMSEAQSVMKKLVEGKWEIDGKEWSMKEDLPNLAKSLDNYMGFVAGGYSGDMSPLLWDIGQTLSRNVAVGKIGLNARSTLNQLTSNLHSMVELGPKVFTEGLIDYIGAKAEGGPRAAEAKKIGNLENRSREVALEEFLKKRARTSLGKVYRVAGEASMKPLQFFDMVTAEITWRGAYKSAMDGEVKGIGRGDQHKAALYANETVTRTQGSTMRWDLTPFQRKQVGKLLGTLQNFVINEYGFLTRDVFQIGRADKNKAEMVKKMTGMMLGAAIIDWLYEDVFGMRSPMNFFGNIPGMARAGVKGFEEKKGGTAAKVAHGAVHAGLEAASNIPIIGRGFSQYGGGGGLGAGIETVQRTGKFLERPSLTEGIDIFGSMAGIPGAYPIARGIKTIEKGGNLPQAVFGADMNLKKKKKGHGFSLIQEGPAPKHGFSLIKE